MPAARIPSTYDSLFRVYGAALPLPFLKALAWNESRMDPSQISRAGARGLLQIMPAPLSDFNRAHHTTYARDDLHRPDVNVAIAAWLLRTIVRGYARHHPRTLATNWNDDRFVALVVLGWNRGFSEVAGVGYVVGKMEAEGWPAERITARAVVENAERLGGARTLRNDPTAYGWARAVVASYRAQAGTSAVVRAGAGVVVGVVALALAIGTAVASRKAS